MTIPRTLPDQMADVYRRLAELERRARNRKRTGKVVEVDHAKGLARVELSRQGGKPFLSPWMPWQEVASGGIKSHIPPTVGEQVTVVSENGDLTDAEISMSVPSNANPRPHDGPEAVITKGESRVVIGDDEVSIASTTICCDATTIRLLGDVEIEGGRLTHNGVNVGDDHVHTDVVPGPANTGPPAG